MSDRYSIEETRAAVNVARHLATMKDFPDVGIDLTSTFQKAMRAIKQMNPPISEAQRERVCKLVAKIMDEKETK
jgi:hypothetical protein